MKKFSFITVCQGGDRIKLSNVLLGIIYKEDVPVLKVLAEVNEENLFSLVANGVEFVKDDKSYIIDFIPMCLESTRK